MHNSPRHHPTLTRATALMLTADCIGCAVNMVPTPSAESASGSAGGWSSDHSPSTADAGASQRNYSSSGSGSGGGNSSGANSSGGSGGTGDENQDKVETYAQVAIVQPAGQSNPTVSYHGVVLPHAKAKVAVADVVFT